MRFKTIALTGALLAALAAGAQATVLPYKNVDRLVGESEGIVIGTVRSVETGSGRKAGDLYTFVTIDQLEVLSGQVAEGKLTLRLKGGFDGRQGLHVEGAPQFTPNERVLLFVQGNGRDLVPFVGWSQGVFRLVDDGQGKLQVRDADGNAVIGLDGGHVQRQAGTQLETAVFGAPEVVRQRAAAPRASAGSTDNGSAVTELRVQAAAQAPMSAERFVAEVRQRAGRGSLLGSVTALDTQQRSSGDDARDAAAPGAPSGAAPTSRIIGNGVSLPAPRKTAPAPDQR